jgi:uncharacterized membrane protein YqaE (UPF0057 family)
VSGYVEYDNELMVPCMAVNFSLGCGAMSFLRILLQEVGYDADFLYGCYTICESTL